MTFNSIPFVIFFVAVTTAYFLLAHRFRWILLLAASIYFYMYWNVWLISLIMLTVTIDYVAAHYIEKETRPWVRKALLVVSLVSNLGILGLFKYYDFFSGSLNTALASLGLQTWFPTLHLILPIGISFHTFQALSYTIDVYRGVTKTERHYGIYALYVLFYPQLVSGPIERSNHFLPQLHREHAFDDQRAVEGLRMMLWGFFKKVAIADRLAIYVSGVYGAPHDATGLQLIVATWFFAFQIYCDFSGYTDIAIGAAKVMGFNLIKNFDRPYFAKSVPEFWHRWHISLSTWFRDYLYKPLGGSRVPPARWYWNMLVVFLLSGLWHGANWTYVIWGGLHAVYMMGTDFWFKIKERLRIPALPLTWWSKGINVLITFNLVSFAWIFFRAKTITDAWYIATHLFTHVTDAGNLTAALGHFGFALALCLIGVLLWTDFLLRRVPLAEYFAGRPAVVRWTWYFAMILGLVFLGVDTTNQFIYFQF